MGLTHCIVDWLGQWGQPRAVPPEHDLELLDGMDGMETAYMSLDERRAVTRLVASGHARLERIAIIGTRVFNRLRLVPQRPSNSAGDGGATA